MLFLKWKNINFQRRNDDWLRDKQLLSTCTPYVFYLTQAHFQGEVQSLQVHLKREKQQTVPSENLKASSI